MTTFQRARSSEQRAERRRVILATAAQMLTRMPVRDLTLNGLAREVGLAKSNVLRYFETREAVLLTLLITETDAWLDALTEAFPGAVGSRAKLATRCERLATLLADTLAERPVLCELMAARDAVLERNVSREAVVEYKRRGWPQVHRLAELVAGAVPEVAADAGRYAAVVQLMAGALWVQANPAPTLREAYETEPALAPAFGDFRTMLQDLLAVLLHGLLARPAL